MNIHNKDQFAEAFDNLDATDEPRIYEDSESIRNAIDKIQYKELCKNESGEWYLLERGEPQKVES